MESHEDIEEDDFIFFSLLYSSITICFAMAVLSKFLTNEFRFGFRSILSLLVLFVGEPLCHFFIKGPVGIIVFGFGCLFIYTLLPASHMTADTKSVFITGCDSGFGNAVVKKLDSLGMTVFAGCLYKNGPGAIDLMNRCSERLHIVQLDVTDETEVHKAVEYVQQHTNKEGLWGLVNNAGTWCMSELEMTPENVFQRCLDINLMGTVRVTRAFLPMIRQTKGRIIHMSSLVGSIPMESAGAYCVSKHGIEAYANVLRKEMKKWDVHVSIIQPAGFKTAALTPETLREHKDRLWENLDDDRRAAYGQQYLDRLYAELEALSHKLPSDLTPVVRAIRSALLSKRPMTHYPVGTGARTMIYLLSLVPSWIGDRVTSLIAISALDATPAALQQN